MSEEKSRGPKIEHSKGVIFGENVTVGDVSFTAAPSAAESLAEETQHFQDLGERYLARRSYEQAVGAFERSVEKGSASSATLLGLALALLRGRRPRTLAPREVQVVEQHLRAALELTERPGHLFLLLAFIKHDFYRYNGFDDRPPTYRELVRRYASEPSAPDGLERVLQHVPIESFLQSISAKARQ